MLWTLEQIRPTHAKNPRVNRPLARLYENRGNFNQAIALWEQVRKAAPGDVEAQRKAKDLAASATIAKGRYEEAVKGDAPTPLVPETEETQEGQPALNKTDVAMPKLADNRSPREVASAQERIKNDPKNPHGYLQLAGVHRRADQFDQARAILQQGLAATGNHFDIHQELLDLDIEPFRAIWPSPRKNCAPLRKTRSCRKSCARLSKEIGTRELEYFRRRSDRSPTDSSARFEMGLRLLRVGQIDEAIKELQAVAQRTSLSWPRRLLPWPLFQSAITGAWPAAISRKRCSICRKKTPSSAWKRRTRWPSATRRTANSTAPSTWAVSWRISSTATKTSASSSKNGNRRPPSDTFGVYRLAPRAAPASED